MRKKGYVYRASMLFGVVFLGFNVFGSALYSRWNNSTPEGEGEGSGLLSPEMMEIDALLKVKAKREEYYKRREEKLKKVREAVPD
jgi:hypothetical protein